MTIFCLDVVGLVNMSMQKTTAVLVQSLQSGNVQSVKRRGMIPVDKRTCNFQYICALGAGNDNRNSK